MSEVILVHTSNKVILDAFIMYLNDNFIRSRKDADLSKIFNPYYFEQGEFVSLEGFDKHGNIVYKQRQPGNIKGSCNNIISISVHYDEYMPYHKKYTLQLDRDKLLEEILG